MRVVLLDPGSLTRSLDLNSARRKHFNRHRGRLVLHGSCGLLLHFRRVAFEISHELLAIARIDVREDRLLSIVVEWRKLGGVVGEPGIAIVVREERRAPRGIDTAAPPA